MTIEHKLLKLSFAVVLLLFISVFLLRHFSVITHHHLKAIMLGACITTLNFMAAIISIESGGKKSHKSFLGNFLQWMVIRLFLLLGIIIFSLKFLDINENSFIFSVLIFYIYYLIIEVIFLNIRQS